MTTSTVTDMSLGQNGGSKQSVNGGNGGGRRKSNRNQLIQKKNKVPQRGLGVAQLERILKQDQSTELVPNFTAFNIPTVTFPTNVAVHFRHAPTPAMLVQGVGIHGANLYHADRVVDPVIGSSNACFRFENSKEFSSISSYMRCATDGCGICYKKKRISDGSNHCSVNPLRSFCGSNAVVEMIDAGKTRRSSSQVTDVMSVHRNRGGSMMEYEFFPGKVNGVNGVNGAEEYKELMSIGSTAGWCGSGGSVAGTLGLRGGEGSCVTAITGGEEGSVSSLDLSLKLSY